jgi:hypothetical protein
MQSPAYGFSQSKGDEVKAAPGESSYELLHLSDAD